MRTIFSVLLLILLLGFCPIHAATITGDVRDKNTHLGIAGAQVKLLGTDKYAVTDSEGVFSITIVVDGTYAISVSATGYQREIISNIKTALNTTPNINAELIYGIVPQGGPIAGVKYMKISSDGKRAALCYEKGNKLFVQMDDSLYGPFDDVIHWYGEYITASAKGSKLGFSYCKDSKWYVQINHDVWGPFIWVSENPKNSIDGAHYWFVGLRDGRQLMYVYTVNEKYYSFSQIDANGPGQHIVFSKNGQFSFMSLENGKHFLHWDNKRIELKYTPEEYEITNKGVPIVMVRDSGYIGYLTYIYIAGEIYGPYQFAGVASDMIGDKPAFWYQVEGKIYIKVGTKEWGPFDDHVDFLWSDDGSRYIFSYVIENIWYVNYNGTIIGNFPKRPFLKLSNNGIIYSMHFESNDSLYLYTNCPIKERHKTNWLTITNDPLIYSYNYSDDVILNKYGNLECGKGSCFVKIMDETYGPYDRPCDVGFAPDGLGYFIAYVKNDLQYTIIDGSTNGPYHGVRVGYLPNSNDIAMVIYGDDHHISVKINDSIYGPFDQLINNNPYGEGRLEWYIRYNKKHTIMAFGFIKEDKKYIQVNNKTYGPYDVFDYTITEQDKLVIAHYQDGKIIRETICP